MPFWRFWSKKFSCSTRYTTRASSYKLYHMKFFQREIYVDIITWFNREIEMDVLTTYPELAIYQFWHETLLCHCYQSIPNLFNVFTHLAFLKFCSIIYNRKDQATSGEIRKINMKYEYTYDGCKETK